MRDNDTASQVVSGTTLQTPKILLYRLVDFIHLQHLLQVSNCSTLTITIVRVCDKNTSFSSKSATSQSYCILACCLFQNSIKKVAQRAMKMVKNIVAGLSTTYVTCQTKYLYNNMLYYPKKSDYVCGSCQHTHNTVDRRVPQLPQT